MANKWFRLQLHSKISSLADKIPTTIKSNEDVVFISRMMKQESVTPIFTVSNSLSSPRSIDLFCSYRTNLDEGWTCSKTF